MKYLNSEVKDKLTKIYKILGISRKAVGTHIKDFYECNLVNTKVKYERPPDSEYKQTFVPQNGYILTSFKKSFTEAVFLAT